MFLLNTVFAGLGLSLGIVMLLGTRKTEAKIASQVNEVWGRGFSSGKDFTEE